MAIISHKFMHFDMKLLVGDGGGLFYHLHPCTTILIVIVPIIQILPIILIVFIEIYDFNGIDPTTTILSLIIMVMAFLFFLTKSLSLVPKCFDKVVALQQS